MYSNFRELFIPGSQNCFAKLAGKMVILFCIDKTETSPSERVSVWGIFHRAISLGTVHREDNVSYLYVHFHCLQWNYEPKPYFHPAYVTLLFPQLW